jgi:hypothetical protein
MNMVTPESGVPLCTDTSTREKTRATGVLNGTSPSPPGGRCGRHPENGKSAELASTVWVELATHQPKHLQDYNRVANHYRGLLLTGSRRNEKNKKEKSVIRPCPLTGKLHPYRILLRETFLSVKTQAEKQNDRNL